MLAGRRCLSPQRYSPRRTAFCWLRSYLICEAFDAERLPSTLTLLCSCAGGSIPHRKSRIKAVTAAAAASAPAVLSRLLSAAFVRKTNSREPRGCYPGGREGPCLNLLSSITAFRRRARSSATNLWVYRDLTHLLLLPNVVSILSIVAHLLDPGFILLGLVLVARHLLNHPERDVRVKSGDDHVPAES